MWVHREVLAAPNQIHGDCMEIKLWPGRIPEIVLFEVIRMWTDQAAVLEIDGRLSQDRLSFLIICTGRDKITPICGHYGAQFALFGAVPKLG